MNKFDATRKRQHRITIRLDEKEYNNLCVWSTAANMTMNEYIRQLINGFQPVEFPPAEYKQVIDELQHIGINMNQLATKAHSLGFIDEPEYRKNANEVWRMVARLAQIYLQVGARINDEICKRKGDIV